MLRRIFRSEYPADLITALTEKNCLESAVICSADIGYRVYDSSLPGFYRYIGVDPGNGGMSVYYNHDSSFYEMDRVMLATRAGWYTERSTLQYCYSLYSVNNLYDLFQNVKEIQLPYTHTSIAVKSLALYILQRGISGNIKEPMELMKIEGIYPFGDIRISNPLEDLESELIGNSYKYTTKITWLN